MERAYLLNLIGLFLTTVAINAGMITHTYIKIPGWKIHIGVLFFEQILAFGLYFVLFQLIF